METLAQIYERHSGPGKFNDKNTTHSYIPAYEELLAPYRETAKRVCEIGIFDGHSLRMLSEYFANAEVHGIDCSDQPHGGLADLRPMISEGKHHIHIMDATNESDVASIFGALKLDVAIDDASHDLAQQIELRKVWEKYMAPESLYIIEDLQSPGAVDTFSWMGARIIDLRGKKNRYDDILAVFGGKQ